MLKVYNKETNEFLGRIAQTDLDFLAEHLEEEGVEDRDYYVRRDTFETIKNAGASAQLIEVMEGGLRGRDALEIRWEEDSAEK